MLTYPKYTIRARQQRGSALVIATFVIVVMGLLVYALFGVFGSSTQQSVANIGGARAQFAAQSATQAALLKLFPTSNAAADCSTTEVLEFTEPGLQGCSATVTCSEFNIQANVAGFNASHYRLQAEGLCELGTITYSRRILTEATDAND